MAVKEKKKGKLQMANRRQMERFALLFRRFDLLCLALGAVIVVCAWFAAGAHYDLGASNHHGYVLWFLLLVGYLPLELLGLLQWLTGCGAGIRLTEYIQMTPAYGLAAVDLALVFVVWLTIRLWAGRRYGMEFLYAAGVFVLIFVLWGVFQLFCANATLIWERGGCTKLHRHFDSPAGKPAAPPVAVPVRSSPPATE